MRLLLAALFILTFLPGCSTNGQSHSSASASVQTVDMGKFKGLTIIQIASITYPADTDLEFSEVHQANFSQSLIQSLRKSSVQVLPSAQTKLHISFTKLSMDNELHEPTMAMSADVAISRNGIITRKAIQSTSLVASSNQRTRDLLIENFIRDLGQLLREQALYKR